MVDQFKKQVMFLHPEPSVMQPCAAMLGDQYSIHMASSGTEALTTLGITPIDIIVSAQDLPGMTGQEALREAKKRSPATRGILIADETMTADDVAALVTVKHLNQILNANVSVSEICAAVLFELKAKETGDLPQPANDHSAGPGDSAPVNAAATGSFRTGATGSFRTDSMRVDLAATGNFESLQQEIPVLEPGVAAVNAPAAISEVELVVLTNDSSFLKTIRAATGTSHVVNHAPNLQEAVDIVQEGRSGVLITDAAVAVKDVETITAKLRRYMPSLVTVVAGRREDGEKMMGLINDGLVYRFLLKPISPGRSRLAIEASAKKHLTLISTDVPLSPHEVEEKMTETGIIKGVTFDSGLFRTTDVRESDINMPSLDDDLEPSAFGRISDALRAIPPLALAALAVVIAVVGVFLFGGSDSPDSESTESNALPAIASTEAPRQTLAERIDAMMASGQQAYDAGRLAAPENDNAVFYYAQAAALNRDDTSLRAALDQTLGQVFESIESNLLADNIDDAARALETLNKNVPGHPRLAFFNAQVGKERARLDLAQAERDIAAGNFPAARSALERLRSGGIVDAALLDTLAARIPSNTATTPTPAPVQATTTTAGRDDIDVLLASGSRRLNDGQLVTPANDSARFYFREALNLQPDNQTARDGLAAVARGLLVEARTAIDARDVAAAEQAWINAVDTGANAIEAESVRRQIEALQTAASRTVTRNTTPQQTTNPAPATADVTTTQTSTTPVDKPPTEQTTVETTIPTVPASIREQSVAAEPREEETSKTATPVDSKPSIEDILKDVSLVVVESRPPIYPRRAQVQRLEGWVDVQFVVGADGTTRDVSVFESSNAMFDRAAVDAVSDWRYEPLPVDDPEAFKRARVRLKFNLD